MGEWKLRTLDDLGKIVGGGTPSTKKKEHYGGKIPWLTPKDLSTFSNRFIGEGERNITEEGLKNSSAKLLPQHTILFSSRAPIGYIAIARNSVTTNQGFKSIIPNDNVDYLFLYYLLKYNKEKIENMGSGTTFKEISGKVMKKIEVKVPTDKKEQRLIAKVLGNLDDKIENNRMINHHLEQMAMFLFDKFFPNVTMGKNTIGKYIIPKRGKGLLSKDAVAGEFPIIAGGLQPAAYHNSANTKAPVITISASGANAGFVNLWTIPVWSSDSSFIDESITNNVYFWYIMLKKRQKEIYDAQTGSAQPHIYPKHITAMLTTELQTKDVEKFNEKIGPLFEAIGNKQKEITKLQLLRDTLLPRLMSSATSISS